MTEDHLYFRQLLAGRDFATHDPMARQMVNFVYLIGDRTTGEAVVVDPAYAVAELVAMAADDDMRLTGALVTHYHQDHVGGSIMGHNVEGVADLLELVGMKVHVQAEERLGVRQVTGLADTDLAVHRSGDVVTVGAVEIELIHTPGHTPGSQCFYVRDRLVAGDTLFLDGCGRTDLPGGDAGQLYDSITTKLAKVPGSATLYPGHQYSPAPSAPLEEVRRTNFVFAPDDRDTFVRMVGG